jgi:hypothetical protein
MIDAAVFGSMMEGLAQRIGKPLGDEGLALYFAILAEELTTEEFQCGVKAIFRDHTFATWPAPADIIDRARPARKLEAAAAWTQLEQAMRARVPAAPLLPQLHSFGVNDTACCTFLAIGGLERWRRSNDWRLDEMRAEFLERFEEMRRLAPVERERLSATALGRPAERPRMISRAVLALRPGPDDEAASA